MPYRWLYPSIMLFCAIGYLFIKLSLKTAPLPLGFMLGPMMEEYPHRTLLLNQGDSQTIPI